MKVKPAIPGTIVRDPDTKRALPDEGDDVPDTSYWLRRLRDGDVVRIDAQPRPELDPVMPLATRGAAPKRKSED